MKGWLRYLWIWIVAGWLTGCNQDLFVDDFRNEVKQVQLESDEDEVTIRFQTDNWIIAGGGLFHSLTGQFDSFSFLQYNEQGVNIGKQGDPYLDIHGSLALRHSLIELYIEHLNSGELKIRVTENLLPGCTLSLVLADKDFPEIEQCIRIQLQTARYELEDITYTLNTWEVNKKRMTRRFIRLLITPMHQLPLPYIRGKRNTSGYSSRTFFLEWTEPVQ